MIRLVVSGFFGRMGSRVAALALKDAGSEVTGALVRERKSKTPKGSIPLSTKAIDFAKKADVFIEFTNPQATLDHLKEIRDWPNIGVVIGTTGFAPNQREIIAQFAKTHPVVLDSNFSLGIAILKACLRAVFSARMAAGFDCHISETHRKGKKDTPSGTAKDLAGLIADLGGIYPALSSLRLGEIPGEHSVTLASPFEALELGHRVYSRDAFAQGALLAAKWVKGKKPGLYSFENVLS